MQPIENFGFENITKIYLEYEEKWWTDDEKGFQLLWSKESTSQQGAVRKAIFSHSSANSNNNYQFRSLRGAGI